MGMTQVLPLYSSSHSVSSSVFASSLWGKTHLILQKLLHSSKRSHKSQFGSSTWLELQKSRVLGSRRFLSSLQKPISLVEKKKSSNFLSLKCFPKLYFSLICVKPQTKKSSSWFEWERRVTGMGTTVCWQFMEYFLWSWSWKLAVKGLPGLGAQRCSCLSLDISSSVLNKHSWKDISK